MHRADLANEELWKLSLDAHPVSDGGIVAIIDPLESLVPELRLRRGDPQWALAKAATLLVLHVRENIL